MAETRNISFGPIAAPVGGVLIVFADDNLRFGPRTRSALGSAAEMVARAARGERFTGKAGTALDIVAPAGLKAARLVVIGGGKASERKPQELVIITCKPRCPVFRAADHLVSDRLCRPRPSSV